MKIGVIGIGVVGKAVLDGFKYIGHDTYFHDIKLNTNIKDVIDADIVYICVGTPSLSNGDCDISQVISTIEQLNKLKYNGIVAIKSTVPPGTLKYLSDRYTELTLCFVPEFLRERCAYADFVYNNNILVVGTNNESVYNEILESHKNIVKDSVQMTYEEAELVKYFSNTYKAMKVTYANSFHRVANKFNADYTKIKDTFLKHGTLESDYLDVNDDFAGYAGMCLPKDVKAMRYIVNKYDLNLDIFRFIDEENEKFVKKVPKGMRK